MKSERAPAFCDAPERRSVCCFCHPRELHHPMKARQDQTEEVRLSSVKDGQNPSDGSVSDKSNGYDIGELATSSLMVTQEHQQLRPENKAQQKLRLFNRRKESKSI
ncbi:hypothetical protein EYF80_031416 [Liparis tanakae]|uniref:Uncharacterized protein n=1 Tax=Liparis tanakae TaxID=230148 RepID=A0A4Z2H008_9TELE|nr:hypothetical protein EYF80_031416 [Liparis tanakae]